MSRPLVHMATRQTQKQTLHPRSYNLISDEMSFPRRFAALIILALQVCSICLHAAPVKQSGFTPPRKGVTKTKESMCINTATGKVSSPVDITALLSPVAPSKGAHTTGGHATSQTVHLLSDSEDEDENVPTSVSLVSSDSGQPANTVSSAHFTPVEVISAVDVSRMLDDIVAEEQDMPVVEWESRSASPRPEAGARPLSPRLSAFKDTLNVTDQLHAAQKGRNGLKLRDCPRAGLFHLLVASIPRSGDEAPPSLELLDRENAFHALIRKRAPYTSEWLRICELLVRLQKKGLSARLCEDLIVKKMHSRPALTELLYDCALSGCVFVMSQLLEHPITSNYYRRTLTRSDQRNLLDILLHDCSLADSELVPVFDLLGCLNGAWLAAERETLSRLCAETGRPILFKHLYRSS